MSEQLSTLEQLEAELCLLRQRPEASAGQDRRDVFDRAVKLLATVREEWSRACAEAERLAEAQGEAIVNSAMVMSELQEAKEALENEIEEHSRAEAEILKLNAELERRVLERTAELEAANDMLREEIGNRRGAEERLRYDALHDHLTGLPNRHMLADHLQMCIRRLQEDPKSIFAVLFLDVDNFKLINDSLGHNMGDRLLVQATMRLAAALRSSHLAKSDFLIARMGGDEFVVVLKDIANPAVASDFAERLQVWFTEPFRLADHQFFVSMSIGIAFSDPGWSDPEEILRNADTAMYRAKHAGKAQYATFNKQMHAEVHERLSLENDFRTALDRNQFRVEYQPIVSLRSGRIHSFEALVRWQHPERGLIPPTDFVPIAEETGTIVPLGRWVMRTACQQLKLWHDAMPAARHVSMGVNVSKRQLVEASLVCDVEAVLKETGLDPRFLNLEITESTVIEASNAVRPVLDQLKRLGVRLHMDDFGTGYSSLSCLHRFPFDVLKIDREFMMNMDGNRQYAAVVFAINTLARNLGMEVIAEGIESKEQLAPVLALDCDYAQGFYFARPADAHFGTTLLRSRLPWIIPAAQPFVSLQVCEPVLDSPEPGQTVD